MIDRWLMFALWQALITPTHWRIWQTFHHISEIRRPVISSIWCSMISIFFAVIGSDKSSKLTSIPTSRVSVIRIGVADGVVGRGFIIGKLRFWQPSITPLSPELLSRHKILTPKRSSVSSTFSGIWRYRHHTHPRPDSRKTYMRTEYAVDVPYDATLLKLVTPSILASCGSIALIAIEADYDRRVPSHRRRTPLGVAYAYQACCLYPRLWRDKMVSLAHWLLYLNTGAYPPSRLAWFRHSYAAGLAHAKETGIMTAERHHRQ